MRKLKCELERPAKLEKTSSEEKARSLKRNWMRPTGPTGCLKLELERKDQAEESVAAPGAGQAAEPDLGEAAGGQAGGTGASRG